MELGKEVGRELMIKLEIVIFSDKISFSQIFLNIVFFHLNFISKIKQRMFFDRKVGREVAHEK